MYLMLSRQNFVAARLDEISSIVPPELCLILKNEELLNGEPIKNVLERNLQPKKTFVMAVFAFLLP